MSEITIKMLQKRARQQAKEKGFDDEKGYPITYGDYCELFHSEISESYAEYRNGNDFTKVYFSSGNKPEGVGPELADAIIRIFDFAEKHGLDMEQLIIQKLDYNKTRSYRHGGKLT